MFYNTNKNRACGLRLGPVKLLFPSYYMDYPPFRRFDFISRRLE